MEQRTSASSQNRSTDAWSASTRLGDAGVAQAVRGLGDRLRGAGRGAPGSGPPANRTGLLGASSRKPAGRGRPPRAPVRKPSSHAGEPASDGSGSAVRIAARVAEPDAGAQAGATWPPRRIGMGWVGAGLNAGRLPAVDARPRMPPACPTRWCGARRRTRPCARRGRRTARRARRTPRASSRCRGRRSTGPARTARCVASTLPSTIGCAVRRDQHLRPDLDARGGAASTPITPSGSRNGSPAASG